MSDSYTSSSYYYSSTTSTTNGTSTTGHRYITSSHTDPDGHTVVRTAHQDLGEPPVIEERRYDRTGQEQAMLEGPTAPTPRITELGEETGSTAQDAGSRYGGPGFGAEEAGNEQARGHPYDQSIDRVTYDSGSSSSSLFGLRSFNKETGAYDSAVEYDADGVPRGRGRGAARSGYTSSEREMRQFEDPSTGARIRRESDINLSDILG